MLPQTLKSVIATNGRKSSSAASELRLARRRTSKIASSATVLIAHITSVNTSSVLPKTAIGTAATNGHNELYWAEKSTSGVNPFRTANVSSSVN